MNLYTVRLKDGGITHEMSARGEEMTAEQAIAYVVSKQSKKVRLAFADGEITASVIADKGNK